jgi:NADPH:quinone reductase-like Zn-dependent oxidoreductase
MSRRVVVTRAGGPEVLELVEGTAPTPGRGQARIRVDTAGVAFGDVMRRRGVFAPRKPFTPGYDVAGVVDAVGEGVDSNLIGTRAAAMMPKPGIGGYAEHVCVPAKRLVHVPDEVGFDEAVCLGLNYITAYQLIHRFAKLERGDTVLIHGAAGGVGTALLDIGRSVGLTMYGTASAPKHDLVRDRGATPIDYRSEDFVTRMRELEPDGVDAVFDAIGGDNLKRSYQVLGPRGTLVMFGVSGDVDRGLRGVASSMGAFASLKLKLDRRSVKFYAITASPGAWPSDCRDDWQALLDMRRDGELAPVIGANVPLERVAEAHDLMDRSAVTGKILMTLS